MDPNEENIQDDLPVIPSDWAYPKIYKQTILLADGSIIDGYAARSSISDEVWVFPSNPDYGYLELIQLFSDPDKTAVIQSNTSEDVHTIYEGYTRLASINSKTDGRFTICMTKPI